MSKSWRWVVGYEGLYKVSSDGNIVSVDRDEYFLSKLGNLSKRSRNGGKLGLTFSSQYTRVSLCKNGVVKIKSVHRVVAIAFIKNKNNYPIVNHKNGDKSDNRVDNLEWSNYSLNAMHSYNVLKREKPENPLNKGGAHPASTPVIQYSIEGFFIKEWPSVIEAQRELGFNSPNIIACCRGKQATCGGYVWKHKNKRNVRRKRKV